MKPEPNYNLLINTLFGGQEDRIPILELIVDIEIKSAFLGRQVSSVAEDIEFWYMAGYDCATVYPDSPSIWFYHPDRLDTILKDDYTESGSRRWASEGKGLIQDWSDFREISIAFYRGDRLWIL